MKYREAAPTTRVELDCRSGSLRSKEALPKTDPKRSVRDMPDSKSRSFLHITVRSLLLLTCLVAMFVALFLQERHINRLRQNLIDDLALDGFHTSSRGNYDWPLHTRWLHRLLGDVYPASLGDVSFGPQAVIDDRTISKICEFTEIHSLLLDGEIYLEDQDILKLSVLRNLEQLNLSNADVSDASVSRLRDLLPRCQISWNPNQQERPK